jgi:hypothetical protein
MDSFGGREEILGKLWDSPCTIFYSTTFGLLEAYRAYILLLK